MNVNNLSQQKNKLEKYYREECEIEAYYQSTYGIQQYRDCVKLPIDIKFIAKQQGYRIEYDNHPTNSKLMGYVYPIPKVIVLYKTLSYKEQRWTIAKAIHLKKTTAIANPLFLHMGDMDSDIHALLSLLPISLFKAELSKYIETTEVFDINDFLEKLSNISQIPLFHLAYGYPLLSQLICFERQKEFAKVDYDITKVTKDEFENIFY